jgi:hypothetical protein
MFERQRVERSASAHADPVHPPRDRRVVRRTLTVGAANDPSEFEADRVADEVVRDLRRSPGALERSELSTRITAAPETLPHGGSAAVQRKVGFEFETGWKVRTADESKRWLKKKDRVGGVRNGYKVEADEAGAGESELEFIVDPPVEEGELGARRLDEIMSFMTTLGKGLEDVARGEPVFNLGTVTGALPDSRFEVLAEPSGELKAGPQVTTGLALSKISSLAAVSRRGQDLRDLGVPSTPAPPELESSMQQLSGRARAMKPAGVPLPDLSPALRGLLAVITKYLEVGANSHKGEELTSEQAQGLALNYPKRIGDLLLARTNFAGLLDLLPRHETAAIRKTVDGWKTLVLANTDPDLQLTARDSVIGRGVLVKEERPEAGVSVPELTIGEWLEGIVAGTDALTEVEDAESLGEFGTRTEAVGGTSGGLFSQAEQAGIFELRGAQANKIPLDRWKPFALEFHRFITAVNDD